MSSVVGTTSLVLPLLTAEEVGALLGGISAKTVHAYAREGRIPSLEVGKHRRFHRPDVERCLTEALAAGRRI